MASPKSPLKGDGDPAGGWALELAHAAAAGDSLAAGKLVRAVTPRVHGVVRAVLGADHPEADDAAQQALIRFVKALSAFRGECEPTTYVTTIALRTALAMRKRGSLAKAHQGVDVRAEQIPDEGLSPHEHLVSERRRQVLRDLLAELPAAQAETLAMRIVLGWSLEEIASQTKAPHNTVRSRLRLAKERLRQRVEGDPALAAIFAREA